MDSRAIPPARESPSSSSPSSCPGHLPPRAGPVVLPPWVSRVKRACCAQGWSTWPWAHADTRVRTYFSVGSLLQIRAGETLLLVSWIRPIASCPGDHTLEGRAHCHKHPACPGVFCRGFRWHSGVREGRGWRSPGGLSWEWGAGTATALRASCQPSAVQWVTWALTMWLM